VSAYDGSVTGPSSPEGSVRGLLPSSATVGGQGIPAGGRMSVGQDVAAARGADFEADQAMESPGRSDR